VRGDLLELAVDVVLRRADRGDVVEGAGLLELVHRPGARLHVLGLVHGALHRHAHVGHLLADAGGGLGDVHLGLGRRVLRLDDLLLGPEGLDLGPQLLLVVDQLLLLVLELGHLLVERLELALGERLALERRPGEVLLALRHRLARLGVELDDLLLERALLHLQALLGRHHVGDALLHVLKQLELLLVAVVEGLAGILRAIQQLGDLRLYDRRHAAGQAWHRGPPLRAVDFKCPQAYPRGEAPWRAVGRSEGAGRARCARLTPIIAVKSAHPGDPAAG
jgi:hypothetical protein